MPKNVRETRCRQVGRWTNPVMSSYQNMLYFMYYYDVSYYMYKQTYPPLDRFLRAYMSAAVIRVIRVTRKQKHA